MEPSLSTKPPDADHHADRAGIPTSPRVSDEVDLDTVPLSSDPLRTRSPAPPTGDRASPSGAGDAEAPHEQIGDYEILALIAAGGMGVVYKARQVTLGRVVALKMMLRADTASEDDIRRFHAEAEAAAQLDHPGIVPIFEVGEVGGRHYFSMAFVDGGSLLGKLAPGPMESLAAAGLLETVCAAIDYGHTRGIIHRDLKPANILLMPDGTPKVTDFGLAKRVENPGDLTHAGQVLGTPSYMPPEQARGDLAAIGPASDIYALGAVLYHVVTGRPPFLAATVMATLKLVLEAEPVPPRQLNPQVDRDLETIALKCLEKEPHRRYPTAAAVAADLHRFIAGEPILARPTPAWERAYKWSRRRPAVALLALVSLLALMSMALGGLFWAQAADQRAKLAERDADDRTEELARRDALDATRQDLRSTIRRATRFLEADSLQEAEVAVEQALAKAGDTPALAAERQEIEALKADLAGRLAAQRDRTAARTRLADFDRLRDEAIFYGSHAFGLDPLKNLATASAAARNALAIWGIDPSAMANDLPRFDAQSPELVHYAPAEVDRIRRRCSELLLVEADASIRAAGPIPPDAARDSALAAIALAVQIAGSETKATHLERAECLRRCRDNAGADRERALAEGSSSPDTSADSFLVGKLLLHPDSPAAETDLTRAKLAFEQTLLLEPDHFWAQYSLAMLGLRLQRPEMADVYLTSCIARRPDFTWAHILRGSARTRLEEFDLAAADFEHALALEPEPEARYTVLVNRADLELAKPTPSIDEARRLLREAIDLKPEEFQAILGLATIEARQGRLDEAFALLDRAVAIAPTVAVIHRERARLQAQRKDFAAAEADLQAAIRLESAAKPRANDLASVGLMRFRQGKLDSALVALAESLALDPTQPLAHLWHAAILVDRGRLDEALPSFDAYLRLGGRPNVDFHLTRGMCRARLDDFAAAIDDYSRAIELEPTAVAHAKRGWLYALRGNPLFGLRDFDRALALDPTNADAHCGRGMALATVGRHADATDAAERALELAEPTFAETLKAASVFALAAQRVVFSEEERRRQGPTPAQLRIGYIERAAGLVDRALDSAAVGVHDDLWREHIEPSGHFQPLLVEPEFRKLKEEVFERSGDT